MATSETLIRDGGTRTEVGEGAESGVGTGVGSPGEKPVSRLSPSLCLGGAGGPGGRASGFGVGSQPRTPHGPLPGRCRQQGTQTGVTRARPQFTRRCHGRGR